MPSFDIVSKTDLSEVDNALANMSREMEQRYDFKGASASIERKGDEIQIHADDDLKLKQMHELLQGHLARRQIDAGCIEYKTAEKAAGQSVRQTAVIRQGIDKELAKKLHPDRTGGCTVSENKLKQINEAYATLRKSLSP